MYIFLYFFHFVNILFRSKNLFKKIPYRVNHLADDTTAFIGQYITVFNDSSYRTRFDVEFQYQRSEAMMTSESISVLVIAQISALGIYAGGSWLFRQAKDEIPVYLYSNLIIWVYVS